MEPVIDKANLLGAQHNSATAIVPRSSLRVSGTVPAGGRRITSVGVVHSRTRKLGLQAVVVMYTHVPLAP